MNEKYKSLNCKNCPDRHYCFTSPTSWNCMNKNESALIFLRILRCRSSGGMIPPVQEHVRADGI